MNRISFMATGDSPVVSTLAESQAPDPPKGSTSGSAPPKPSVLHRITSRFTQEEKDAAIAMGRGLGAFVGGLVGSLIVASLLSEPDKPAPKQQ